MKLIKPIQIVFSLIALGLSSLEAKTIECFLNHQTETTVNVEANIRGLRQEEPFNRSSFLYDCRQLKIENLGSNPIKHCFPSINQAPSFTVEDLAFRLQGERYPLLALYQLWNLSLVRDKSCIENDLHPLDLLNFRGVCSPEVFNQQFLKLCNALGIETRLANVQKGEMYDFGINEEWNFLDVEHQQHYLQLDNETLASSEDIMDDPFLALRTKHRRDAQQVDFSENWKQIASFDILKPASAVPMVHAVTSLTKRAQGFDLFPGETFLFETPAVRKELGSHECGIEHIINLEARHVSNEWKYRSFFPIQCLVNASTTGIYLVDQDIHLEPGKCVEFKEKVFKVKLTFASDPKGEIKLSGKCSWTLFPSLVKGKNRIYLGAKKNPSLIRLQYEVNEDIESSASVLKVSNPSGTFDFTSPYFQLETFSHSVEKIWWQIALDDQFTLIPPNFDQVETFSSVITLPLISETFLSPETLYYFRIKGFCNGQWSEWSVPFQFVLNKPAAVEEVLFEEIGENEYELNWERYAEEKGDSLEYLVFASNSLDFIPSIYCQSQINAIVNGQVVEEEINDNLVAITQDAKIRVNGQFAYYRIIARKHGQLSVPSKIIHVYDQGLIQPRNVLQVVKDQSGLAKRMLFPPAYSWSDTALPHISLKTSESIVVKLESLFRSKSLDKKISYELPDVPDEVWEEVKPYLLPENHPAWAKLNRVFCATRATQSHEHFKKAGFRRWRPGRWSRVSASSHPEFPEYFIKAYCDIETGIIYDWKKWIHRIKGAEFIRECIEQYHLKSQFKVPHKWLYPMPRRPSPPNTQNYIRKNFILVCENMRIQDHDKNEKMYKHQITQKLMDGLYTILQVCGLYDSVYVFNMPFCKDGRIAIIDTEYHHKWPVPYQKLTNKFPSKLQSYWKRITFKGGKIPDGVNQYNPPRMDRRDIRN